MDRYHILICDDEESVRESLRAYLENSYELSFAETGQEALDNISNNAFDLLIIDIKMPGISGLEAIRQIKDAKPEQKIIVLSGYESISVAEQASKYNITSYLTKPVSKDKLLKTVSESLG